MVGMSSCLWHDSTFIQDNMLSSENHIRGGHATILSTDDNILPFRNNEIYHVIGEGLSLIGFS